jgi:hypothetical protein
MDRVQHIRAVPKNAQKLSTLAFEGDLCPTLFQLANAAMAVHRDSPYYLLFTRQCYWFSDVLIRVLATEEGDQAREDEMRLPEGVTPDSFEKHVMSGEIKKHIDKGGRFYLVKILKGEDIVVKAVRADYHARRRDMENKVWCSSGDLSGGS